MALGLLARIHFLQKQYGQSIASYRQALAASANQDVRTTLYYNLAMAQLSSGDFAGADESMSAYLSRQNYVTAEDNKVAGAIAYALGDHQRAFRRWQHLTSKQKREILNAIEDDSDVYSKLASVK